MKQVGINATEHKVPNFHLVEFSVVLLDSSTNPSLLSPDFLFRKNILDEESWSVEEFVSTPLFSTIQFKEGLTLRAEQNRVTIEQKSDRMVIPEIQCAEIAESFLNALPYSQVSAIGVNPKGLRTMPEGVLSEMLNLLKEGGRWLSHESVAPEIQLKTVYRFETKIVNLSVAGGKLSPRDGNESDILFFQSNIHHDIQGNNPEERDAEVLSILNAWKEDLNDFFLLASKFDLP